MASSEISLVRESYKRCSDQLGFFEYFYELFNLASPEMEKKFAHSDMDHQAVMLRASMEIMTSGEDPGDSQGHLKMLAGIHGPDGMAIRPGLYELWHEALMEAVRKFDEDFNQAVEEAWNNTIKEKIAFISSHC